MASRLRMNDDVQMNKINVTTFTGDYGIPRDGFPKNVVVDNKNYFTQRDETQTMYDDPPDIDTMANSELSGPMYLKTVEAKGQVPFLGFPARKFEYGDGRVSWFRPYMPWSWMGKGAKPGSSVWSTTENASTSTSTFSVMRDNQFLFALTFVALVLFIGSNKIK